MKSEKQIKDYLKQLKKSRERYQQAWVEYDNLDDLEALKEADNTIEALEWVLG